MNCGTIVDKDAKRCPVCGSLLTDKNEDTKANVYPFFQPIVEEKEEEIAQTQEIETPVEYKEEKPVEKVEKITEEPAEEEPEKHRGVKILVIIILVLLIVLAACFNYMYRKHPAELDAHLEKVTEVTGIKFPKFSSSDSEESSTEQTNTETTAPAPAEEKPAVETPAVIGKAEVLVTGLHIRTSPKTSAEQIGEVEYGSIHDVYETATGEGMSWYRIGEDQWIGDQDGQWVSYTSN